MSIVLLIIDPQVDFCCPGRGSLVVPGAEQDMDRLARMVRRHASEIDAIHVTLDSHHRVDIAHPIFWIDAEGNHPPAFTLVSMPDVVEGRWRATAPEMRARALEYVRALEQGGRHTLCVWPYHCLIGSEGHAVEPGLFEALRAWEEQFRVVDFVSKGTNPYTEHYSAIRAEVADPGDPGTQVNQRLIDTLLAADRVLIGGEAGSHCVAQTVQDLAEHFGDRADRLTLLTDAVSPVPGFEPLQETFLAEMAQRGLGFRNTVTAFDP